MKSSLGLTVILALALSGAAVLAQDDKPVPKDSMRVSIPGCAKGQMFTAGRRIEGLPGSVDIPEGMHLRMNGPKKLMSDIKAHEGSMIVIHGLVKKGQYGPDGVNIGGVRIGPGPGGGASVGVGAGAAPRQIFIDVEGWQQADGGCPVK